MPARRPPTSWNIKSASKPFDKDAAFDALRHQFAAAGGFLRVAVGRALRHRAHGTHAAIALESAALVKNGLARTFFGARQQAADHHAIGAGRDGLGDVARKFDAAVGDQRDSAASRRLGAFGNRGDLRNAGAADHARGADRSRPDANLDAVDAQRDQFLAPS